MRIYHAIVVAAVLLISQTAAAQQVTPAVPGAATPASTPLADDPRLSLCTAPTLEGFEPHIVRPGDRMADFLTGASYISITQLAALNCLDDPAALPVGGVIWVPSSTTDDTAAVSENGEPAIVAFSASAETIQNQDEVTFQWQATGGEAYFYRCPADPDEDCSRPALAPPLPLAHEMSLADFAYAGPARYRLEVVGNSESITEDITLEVSCSQQWLGPITEANACPPGPALAVAAVRRRRDALVLRYAANLGDDQRRSSHSGIHRYLSRR
jgi:hypothetical protein